MLVTIDEFNTYTGNMESDKPVKTQKTGMLKSAETIVINYLGYNPTIADRTDHLSGIGSDRLYFRSRDINTITSVTIDGTAYDSSAFEIHTDYIRKTDGSPFPHGIDNITAVYNAGLAEDSSEMALVKSSILRIAALMLQESNGNIGLTGRSFGDQSKTYVSYNNYEKYLRPLDPICCVRFD